MVLTNVMFVFLSSYAGLYCTVLTGFAKGLDYRPGDKFKGSEYNHSWNAVYIDGNWYLVDSHWATRYLISEKNMPENLVSYFTMLEKQVCTFFIQGWTKISQVLSSAC